MDFVENRIRLLFQQVRVEFDRYGYGRPEDLTAELFIFDKRWMIQGHLGDPAFWTFSPKAKGGIKQLSVLKNYSLVGSLV